MVPDETVHPVIVGHRVSGPELYDDLDVCVPVDGALGLVELKDVARVREELVLGAHF